MENETQKTGKTCDPASCKRGPDGSCPCKSKDEEMSGGGCCGGNCLCAQ